MAKQEKVMDNYVNKTIVKDKIYDQRILFNPTLKPDFFVEVGADGITPVVPVTDVEHIMIENEELRNTLYTEQCTLSNHVSRMLIYYSKSNTSDVKKQIKSMSIQHNIPIKDLYDLVFSILPKDDDLVTLYDYWSAGCLPILSVHIQIIQYTLDLLKPAEVQNMMKKVTHKVLKSALLPI